MRQDGACRRLGPGEGLAMSCLSVRSRVVVVGYLAIAALVGLSRKAAAQESLVQPSGYSTMVMPSAAGPTWDDFNALAQRLQATEARLQAIGGDNASYETANIEYQN